MPAGSQTLGHNIFHEHSFINLQTVEKNGLVEVIIHVCPVVKGQSHQQTRIRQIALKRRVRNAEIKSNARVFHIKCKVDNHGFIKPTYRPTVFAQPGLRINMRDHKPLVVLGQF